MRNRPSFLDYEPVELAFGTSGMRGRVEDITDLEAYVSVKGALRYLQESGDIRAGASVVLGGDLRPSTERIARASMQAITDGGWQIEYAGRIPTPALVLHGISTGRAGVMVTGSHIPFDRNGIKVSKSGGELRKSDEPGVLAAIARVRAEEYAKSASSSAFDSRGMLKQPSELPAPDPAAGDRYRNRYVDAFPANALRGWRIAFYQHSAVGRDSIPGILSALGAEVIPVDRSDTFVPIDTENIGEDTLDRLDHVARELAAIVGGVDAIVSTDGDSDRPLMLAVRRDGRQRVRFLPGDLLGLVVAEHLRADAASVPISANDAVDLRLRERGVALEKTRIGSPYVIDSLEAHRRRGASRVVGWEANGGFLLGTDVGAMSALPTRDAVLPIVVNLVAAASRGATLGELWDGLPRRFGRAGLIDEVPVATSRAIVAALGAEPETTVPRFFSPELGFGTLEHLDKLDGVRIYFDNGDVAHLRPSGNAPQLRVYANASTQQRADAIVDEALRQPDGILRRLERAFTTA